MATPELQWVRRIWNRAPHNSLADIIRYKGKWLCALREGPHHYKGGPGQVLVLSSDDCQDWEIATTLRLGDYDLRDPHFSVDPSGQLLMIMGASTYSDDYGKIFLGSVVTFSSDGLDWSEPEYVLGPNEWLWRIVWHEGKAYAASYSFLVPGDYESPWRLKLFSSEDCRNWTLVSELKVPDRPNETTLRFTDGGELIAWIRREGGDKNFWLGRSQPPYSHWDFTPGNCRVGGPNFIPSGNGSFWGACRICEEGPNNTEGETTFGKLKDGSYEILLTLPSGGDNSYPGFYREDDQLWLSYYSSHEDKAAIYLAKLQLPATP